MSATQSQFRVLIVGGSIAGLTLAHCLQRANIDHLVLEKGSDIAPQLGASVGILPNGGRILDQLNLFDTIEQFIEPTYTANVTYPDGFTFSNVYPKTLGERFGYPIAFLDRQKLLQILYEKSHAKKNILASKEIVKVQRIEQGVRVIAADGSQYDGSLVVGADGVHSRIRSEIWRLAEELKPGLISTQERTCMTVEYACIFGISSQIPNLEISEQINGLFDHLSILTIHGKKGRVFWFIITKLPRKYTYPNVPRFSDKDAAKFMENLKHVRFFKNVCVGDLWKNREVFSMTALEEGLFRTWFFDRMVLIGDSVHKMTTNFGQGANSAIEDAATLSSLLYDLVHGCGVRNPSDAEIQDLLQKYHEARYDRMKMMCHTSAEVCRTQARDGLYRIFAGRYMIPYSRSIPADLASKVMADADKITFLSCPKNRSALGWQTWGKEAQRATRVRRIIRLLLFVALGVFCFWVSGRGSTS
ncbi:FAD-dependent oxidoreductase [Aspergillus saccharolyticus JOP 1030-1]|uniref:Flavo protein monooxygenase n=1 Tax=Aspergillus saccharolyticus JOP 1030-1 TaxID=1450539 RepID=A0A318ZFG5_9EURO|nr:flavo protein monooxygenase [Aspergillus saccharolyticus JOP 1030-1]PYH45064.1 flavo protein monooxygenase [Aspergillus saccharolyticus JOP 1030-1]